MINVNYHTFMKKFECLLPAKKGKLTSTDVTANAQKTFLEQRRREAAVRKIAFRIVNVDGDDELSLYDLIWTCSQFSPVTQIGNQLSQVFELYMSKNVMQKYVRHRMIIDQSAFYGLISKFSLIDDL